MDPVRVDDPRPAAYLEAIAGAAQRYAQLPSDQPVRLAKRTSNLFRTRTGEAERLDLDDFRGVFAVDPDAPSAAGGGTALVGGLTTYEQLVDELARGDHHRIPLVVPQLRTITLGGAVVGLGIESTSFRHGLPHESVLAADVLTPTGEVVTATPDGEHADLFRALPNSYGTLGYCLGLVVELERAGSHVLLRHLRFTDLDAAMATIGQVMATREQDGEAVDFLDGITFSGTETYLTLGRWSDGVGDGGTPSDYTGQEIYYRSVQHRRDDVLTTHDYLWRWDTDWFWCAKALGLEQPWVRRWWPRRWWRDGPAGCAREGVGASRLMPRMEPMIGWTPALAAASENSRAPKRLLVSAIPSAGCLSALARSSSLPSGSAPSSSE